MKEHDTLPRLLLKNYKKWGHKKIALRKKQLGIWQEYSWSDYYEQVKYVSLGMVSLGVKRGDSVCIAGDNDPQWWIVELAIQSIGASAICLNFDVIPEDMQRLLEHTHASLIIARDQEQCDKLLSICNSLPPVKGIVYWEYKGMRNCDNPLFMKLDKIIELGKERDSNDAAAFDQIVNKGEAGDTAVVFYSFNGSSVKEGVSFSHKDLIDACIRIDSINPARDRDNYLSGALPSSIDEQIFSLAYALHIGYMVNFVEKLETIKVDRRDVDAEIVLNSVELWANTVSEIQVKIGDGSAIKKAIFNLFMTSGLKAADLYYKNMPVDAWINFMHGLGKLIVFNPLLDKYGLNKCRVAYVTRDVVSPTTFEYLYAWGIKLINVYAGDKSPIITSQPKMFSNLAHCGRPLPGAEIRISLQGEINYRIAANKWLGTSDAGRMDQEGNLYFSGKLSDQFEIEDGFRVSAIALENRLKFSYYIKEALIVDAHKDHVTAVIVIDYPNVGKWADVNNIKYSGFTELSQNPKTISLIEKEIIGINSTLDNRTKLHKFVNLHREFGNDEREAGNTRRLNRNLLQKTFGYITGAINSGKSQVTIPDEIRDSNIKENYVLEFLTINSIAQGN